MIWDIVDHITIKVNNSHYSKERPQGMLLDLQLPVQLVPITSKVVRLKPVHGEVYSIQHYVNYVIKFVSDL
jgi:hypothetical protein